MQNPQDDWNQRIESTDRRLRVSRELSAKSHQSVCRSKDLVLQSRALLAQRSLPVQEILSEPQNRLAGQRAANEILPAPVLRPQRTAPAAGEGLQVVADRCIEGEVVNMDGKHFVDCELVHCTLQYSGQPVIVESTRFEHCGFQFVGEAALTARFLECFQLLAEHTVDYASSPSISGSLRPN